MNSEEGVSEEDALKVKKPSWQKPIVDDMFKSWTAFLKPSKVYKQGGK